MKCKFEHEGYCCNSGTFRFKDTCDMENCSHCAPMSQGDAFRTSSNEELAKFFSSVVSIMDCPKQVWNLYDSGFYDSGFPSYKDAWLKWLQEPCE